jgi:hypothetical protein
MCGPVSAVGSCRCLSWGAPDRQAEVDPAGVSELPGPGAGGIALLGALLTPTCWISDGGPLQGIEYASRASYEYGRNAVTGRAPVTGELRCDSTAPRSR